MSALLDRYKKFWEDTRQVDADSHAWRQLPKDLTRLTLKADPEDHGEHMDHRNVYWALRRYQESLRTLKKEEPARVFLGECETLIFGMRILLENEGAEFWPDLRDADRFAVIAQITEAVRGKSIVEFDNEVTLLLIRKIATQGSVERSDKTFIYACRIRELPAFADPMHNVWRWIDWPVAP